MDKKLKDNLKKITYLNWEEVFLYWNDGETYDSNWNKVAKTKGYDSRIKWRLEGYAYPFKCRETKWNLYKLKNAPELVSNFYGGPFLTWINSTYEGKRTMKFEDLALKKSIQKDRKTLAIAKNYPYEKPIICLQVGEKVYIIDGMHRACALALMHSQGKKLKKAVSIIIGKSPLKRLPLTK